MESFLAVTDEFARSIVEYRAAPSPATQKAFKQAWDKAIRLFDLNQVAPSARHEVSREVALLLWDIIARLELPDLEEIPDSNVVAEVDSEVQRPPDWRIPHTEITIALVKEGPRTGEFLFSPDTVERVRSFYKAARELPYRRPMPSDSIIRTNQLMTGWMIPLAWIEALPGWANTPVLGQVLWKWFAVVLLLGLALAAVILGLRWARRRDWDGSLGVFVRRLSVPLGVLVLALLLRYFFQRQLNLTGAAAGVPDYLIEVAYGIAVVWLVWLTVSWVAEAVIASPRISANSLDAHLIRLTARSVGILVILVLLFRVAGEIGIPVYGLVAGAGVGGLAIALAAKSTLEDFLGAIKLYADRPVRVGDLCRFDEESNPQWRPVGRVEAIGLRSTKIRRFDRGLITIPNSEFAQRSIVNLSTCDRFLMTTTLGLRYETTRDQLRFVLAELRELLHAHPKTIHTDADPVRVRFVGYGDYSLNIAVRAYISTTVYNEFLAVQEDILLRVAEVVEQAGTGFAFPSSTLYLSRDGGLDAEKQVAAEKQVREWGSAQTLPFPDFTEEYRRKITDTLDYPPAGSPGADGGR
jgi:MscS family membrane protein